MKPGEEVGGPPPPRRRLGKGQKRTNRNNAIESCENKATTRGSREPNGKGKGGGSGIAECRICRIGYILCEPVLTDVKDK
jgi:hypothetical protein